MCVRWSRCAAWLNCVWPNSAVQWPPTKVETKERLLHELGVHQIELEIQNEQLRQTQVALEAYARPLPRPV